MSWSFFWLALPVAAIGGWIRDWPRRRFGLVVAICAAAFVPLVFVNRAQDWWSGLAVLMLIWGGPVLLAMTVGRWLREWPYELAALASGVTYLVAHILGLIAALFLGLLH